MPPGPGGSSPFLWAVIAESVHEWPLLSRAGEAQALQEGGSSLIVCGRIETRDKRTLGLEKLKNPANFCPQRMEAKESCDWRMDPGEERADAV